MTSSFQRTDWAVSRSRIASASAASALRALAIQSIASHDESSQQTPSHQHGPRSSCAGHSSGNSRLWRLESSAVAMGLPQFGQRSVMVSSFVPPPSSRRASWGIQFSCGCFPKKHFTTSQSLDAQSKPSHPVKHDLPHTLTCNVKFSAAFFKCEFRPTI